MLGDPVWRDFYGRLGQAEESLRNEILSGGRMADGTDTTPYARVAHGLLLTIMAIPSTVIDRAEALKHEQGFKPTLVERS